MTFTGCGTALITPFHEDLTVDEVAYRRLVRRQIDAGINFLVPCGTTGESPTLKRDEKATLVRICVEEAAGKIPVMAGAGGYDTHEVIESAKAWLALGATGILSVTPYYNKPTQEGLYRHYVAIAEALNAPVFVYNVPGRTGVNVEPATIVRLASVPNIAGVKEASGNIQQMAAITMRVPESFLVLSGDDAITIPLIALGGRGLISVASNEIPAEMTQLAKAALDGDFTTAGRLQRRYQELLEANFMESNPIPVKAVMAMLGLCQPVWRLPLCPPSAATQERLRQIATGLGLLIS